MPKGVNISHGVGSGNQSKYVRIIHHRREKAHCLQHSHAVLQPVYTGVVTGIEPNQQIRVLKPGKTRQNIV